MKAIRLTNVALKWKNASGRPDAWFPNGQRYFGVVLDEFQSDRLSSLGWNVRTPDPIDGNAQEPWITIKVPESFYDISYVDHCDNLFNVDIYPVEWEMREHSGVTAHLIEIEPILESI